LTPVFGNFALWLAAAGFVLALIRARWYAPVLVLWIGLLFIAANQSIFPLPFAGSINLTSVEIMLFMPIAVLGGDGVSTLLHFVVNVLPVRFKIISKFFVAAAVAVVMFFGTQKLLPILNPTTLLFRDADRPAIQWVEVNIPEDATILINPFLWGYGLYAGHDGGYWITPLSGRQTMPPVSLYGMGDRSEILRINQIAKKTLDLSNDPRGMYELLKSENIDYLYLGRRSGAISSSSFAGSPLFQTRYHVDGVWIFEVK
jgi:hypothetical protein